MQTKILEERYNESQRLSRLDSEEARQYFISNGNGAEKEPFKNMLTAAESSNHCVIMYFHDREAMKGYLNTYTNSNSVEPLKAPRINFHSEKILLGCDTKVYTYSKLDGIPRRLNGIRKNDNADLSALLHGTTLYVFFNTFEETEAFLKLNDSIFNGGSSILQQVKFQEVEEGSKSESIRNMLSIIRDNNLIIIR